MVLCGGSESMSQAPYAVRNIRFGTKFGFDLKVGFWLIFFLMPELGMHDNIGTSSVSANKAFKIKYWHWPGINICADMTRR